MTFSPPMSWSKQHEAGLRSLHSAQAACQAWHVCSRRQRRQRSSACLLQNESGDRQRVLQPAPEREHRMSERTPTQEVAVQLMAAVNNMSFNIDEFVAVVTNDHRTLQQTMGRVVFALIKAWAKDYKDNRFDLRNAGTCQACDEIMEKVDEDYFVTPYI
jgi:hypothetical protein